MPKGKRRVNRAKMNWRIKSTRARIRHEEAHKKNEEVPHGRS